MQETDFTARSSTSPQAMSLGSSWGELDASQSTLGSSSSMDNVSLTYTDFMMDLAGTSVTEAKGWQIAARLLTAGQMGWVGFTVIPFVTQAVCLCAAIKCQAVRSLVCKAHDCARPFGQQFC